MMDENLRDFLSAYFHQDWPEESADDTRVIDAYIDTFPDSSEILRLITSLEKIADLHKDESSPCWLIHDFGCYYDPSSDGLTASAWLKKIAGKLRAST